MTLAACARPDWGDVFQDEAANASGRQLLTAMVAADKNCPLCRDVDVNLTLKSPLKNTAVSGYLLFRQPSWIKFVSSNPFGQPVFVAVSDGVRFQQLSIPQKTYLHGQVFSYLVHNNLPLALAMGDWESWLTGGVGGVRAEEAEVRPDRDNRGLWFTWPPRGIRQNGVQEHILVDAGKRQIIARVISEAGGKTIARFDYGNWRVDGPCPQPEKIVVSGLDGGGIIEMVFSGLGTPAECPEDLFQLKKPEHFQEFFLP